MTNPAHQAADRIAKALEAGPTPEWKSAREPNGRGHGWSAGPDAWLGSDAYSTQTAAAAAYIAACSPDNLRALLAERDEMAKDAARLGAELECYRATFGQRDSGLRPLETPASTFLTDAQYALAHNVKLVAEQALGRGTGVALHERRKDLYSAIDELAALTIKEQK